MTFFKKTISSIILFQFSTGALGKPLNSEISRDRMEIVDIKESDRINLVPLFDKIEELTARALYPRSPGNGQRNQGLPTIAEVNQQMAEFQKIRAKIQQEWNQVRGLTDPKYGECQKIQLEALKVVEANNGQGASDVMLCYEQQLQILTVEYFQLAAKLELIYGLVSPANRIERITKWREFYSLRISSDVLANSRFLIFWSDQKKDRLGADLQLSDLQILLNIRMIHQTGGTQPTYVSVSLSPEQIFKIDDQIQFAAIQNDENVFQNGRYLAARNLYLSQMELWLARDRDPLKLPSAPDELRQQFPFLNLLTLKTKALAIMALAGAKGEQVPNFEWFSPQVEDARQEVRQYLTTPAILADIIARIERAQPTMSDEFLTAILTAVAGTAGPRLDLMPQLRTEMQKIVNEAVPNYFSRLIWLWDFPSHLISQEIGMVLVSLYREAVRMAIISEYMEKSEMALRAKIVPVIRTNEQMLGRNRPFVPMEDIISQAKEKFTAKFQSGSAQEVLIAKLREQASELVNKLSDLQQQPIETGVLSAVLAKKFSEKVSSTNIQGIINDLARRPKYKEASLRYFVGLSGLIFAYEQAKPGAKIGPFTSQTTGIYDLQKLKTWVDANSRSSIPFATMDNLPTILPDRIVKELSEYILVGESFGFFQNQGVDEPKVAALKLSEEELKNYKTIVRTNFLTLHPLLAQPKNTTFDLVRSAWKFFSSEPSEQRYTFEDMSNQNVQQAFDKIEENVNTSLKEVAEAKEFSDIGDVLARSILIHESFKARPEWYDDYRNQVGRYMQPSMPAFAYAHFSANASTIAKGAGVLLLSKIILNAASSKVRALGVVGSTLDTLFMGEGRKLLIAFGIYTVFDIGNQGFEWYSAGQTRDQIAQWFLSRADRPGFMQAQEMELAQKHYHQIRGATVFNVGLQAILFAAFGGFSSRLTSEYRFITRTERNLQTDLNRILGLEKSLPADYIHGRNVMAPEVLDAIIDPTVAAMKSATPGMSTAARDYLVKRIEMWGSNLRSATDTIDVFMQRQMAKNAPYLRQLGLTERDFLNPQRVQQAYEKAIAQLDQARTTTSRLGRTEIDGARNRILSAQRDVFTRLDSAPLVRQALGQRYPEIDIPQFTRGGVSPLSRFYPEEFRSTYITSPGQEMEILLGVERVAGSAVLRSRPWVVNLARYERGPLRDLDAVRFDIDAAAAHRDFLTSAGGFR